MKTGKIKLIEPRKEECKIFIKTIFAHERIDTKPEYFDAILDYIVSISPKASFGKIIKD